MIDRNHAREVKYLVSASDRRPADTPATRRHVCHISLHMNSAHRVEKRESFFSPVTQTIG